VSAVAALAPQYLPCRCEDCPGNPVNRGGDFHDWDTSTCKPREEPGSGLLCGRCKGEGVLVCEGWTNRGPCLKPAVTAREENGAGDFCAACAPEEE
jgi:hypothetical protein